MNSSSLISDLVEARKSPASPEKIQSIVLKLAMKAGLEGFYDDIYKDRINISYDLTGYHLPGIEIRSSLVFTDDFERKYLRPHGWSVISASIDHVSRYHRVVGLRLVQDKPIRDIKPRYLYHASSIEFESKVLRQGIKPRSKSYHPSFRYSEPRIFLFNKLDRGDIRAMMMDIESGEREEGSDRSKGYTVFEIDTDKFNKFNIFKDPAFLGFDDYAVYTKTHIPASAIKKVYTHLWKDDPFGGGYIGQGKGSE